MVGSLKKARTHTFLIHGGYVLMLLMLLATGSWVLALVGPLLAGAGFFLTHQEAKCPKCSTSLLEGGNGLDGVLNVMRLTAASPIQCRSCSYQSVAADYN